MQQGISQSREMIKSRMVRHALNYWGIKNAEDLDPLVKLIMEAISVEIFTLGNEIRDTEGRLLEKISDLLAPGFLTSPNPAHGILHARPAETSDTLSVTDQFFTQKKVSSRQDETLDTNIEVFFTPVAPVKIFDTKINFLATGRNLYTLDPQGNKLLSAQAQRGQQLENQALWVGIKTSLKVSEMQDLSFYFDLKSADPHSVDLLRQLLPLTKWQLGNQQIVINSGLNRQDEPQLGEDVFGDYNLLTIMEKDFWAFYQPKFLSITDTSNLGQQEQVPFPPVFANVFSEADCKKLTEPLLWIKIAFPAAINQEILNDLHLYTNAFPVMNRRLVDLTYRLKQGSEIIPLKTNAREQFLAVHSLSDDSRAFKGNPYRKMEEEEIGTYTLRNGGVERFDNRNAKEFISYLLELLRSESSAFSVFGQEYVSSTLKELNQRIALMEQKTKGLSTTAGELPHYIMARPFEGHELMYVEYWTTLAETANNLKPGTRLQLYSKSKVRPDSVWLLSNTTGGKNRLKPEERITAFRYGLISRDRIVTREDIIAFCLHELGSGISKVQVKKGLELSNNPRESYRKTIDVILTPQTEKLATEEWQAICQQLEAKLINRSGMSNYYRILIQEKA